MQVIFCILYKSLIYVYCNVFSFKLFNWGEGATMILKKKEKDITPLNMI